MESREQTYKNSKDNHITFLCPDIVGLLHLKYTCHCPIAYIYSYQIFQTPTLILFRVILRDRTFSNKFYTSRL